MAGRIQKDVSSAFKGIAVNLASDTTLEAGCRGFHVGVSGHVVVDFVQGGTGITLKNCAQGVPLGYQVSKIYSTANGTTATDIVALY